MSEWLIEIGDNWNAFGCDVSEDLLLGTAQLIVDYGLKDLGYHYVILDDCWSVGRNTSNNNSLIADTTKFPRGMAAVADDLHGLGLGFGMYSDAGKYTCGGYAGSLGYETIDAQTFAGWGVDCKLISLWLSSWSWCWRDVSRKLKLKLISMSFFWATYSRQRRHGSALLL